MVKNCLPIVLIEVSLYLFIVQGYSDVTDELFFALFYFR
jgi:hypothetical protein